MKKYDAIIIGAGNAGLSAGLELAINGKKVLIVEQHNLAGGCATSFRRGRFEFDPSLHELCDVGPENEPGGVRALFEHYGININWCRIPDVFRIVSKYSDGTPMDVTMPCGIEAFIDKMEEYVPGSRESVKKAFDLFAETFDGLQYLSQPGAMDDKKVLIQKYKNLLFTGAYSTTKVFKALKIPQKAVDILSAYWSYLGVELDNLQFAHYAVMVYCYVKLGAYIPYHTSHEMSTALCERFKELGGEIWFNCRADKLLFDGDRACGIHCSAGEVFSDYVIANIHDDIVYGKMIPEELVPERMKKLSNARKGQYGGRMMTAYFGLDATIEELGIKDYSIFLNEGSNSFDEYKNMMTSVEKNNFSIFICQNVVNPEASPKGTAMCSFTTYCGNTEWENLSPENYVALKNKYAEKFIKSLKDKTGIDISNHIEEVAVASPWTFARYIGSPQGCVYGSRAYRWDGLLSRTMEIAVDHPVKGLKTTGTNSVRSDGYNSTYIAGRIIADAVLEEMKEGR